MQRREESDIYYTREKLARMLERFREMQNGEIVSGEDPSLVAVHSVLGGRVALASCKKDKQ